MQVNKYRLLRATILVQSLLGALVLVILLSDLAEGRRGQVGANIGLPIMAVLLVAQIAAGPVVLVRSRRSRNEDG
jgi:hypothetical protein